MRFLYSFLIVLSTPFVLLYFVIRGVRDAAYLKRWHERFGFMSADDRVDGIWIHAASVGEFNAASPLIRVLLKSHPEIPLTITTLTPTGSERARHDLGDRVSHSYIPIDTPGAIKRFLERLQPRLIIVMETEIWPNLYLQSRHRGIPLIMANARLSKRSVARLRYLPGFAKKVLQTVDWIGAQSDADADRLESCGASKQRIEMTGNLKFDLSVSASLEEKAAALRRRWGRHRPVLVAGSTHEADENVVIPAFVELLKSLPDALLILVPRYPERFARAAQLARSAGLRTETYSEGEACSEEARCFVIDTMGELMTYYACADVAYVGGSMGEQGGHNALEPAALGKPVLFGPNMDNAKETASELMHCNAARLVANQEEFQQTAERIMTDGVLRDVMGQAGQQLVEKNRGALKLTLEAIERLL